MTHEIPEYRIPSDPPGVGRYTARYHLSPGPDGCTVRPGSLSTGSPLARRGFGRAFDEGSLGPDDGVVSPFPPYGIPDGHSIEIPFVVLSWTSRPSAINSRVPATLTLIPDRP
jgi:hypothetical protein